MKILAISVKERQNVGKSNTRALRNQGNVPCVLYGGEKQVTFYAHENDFRKLVYTPDTFIAELNIDGSKVRAILQDIQFHPVTDKIIHVDFYQLFDNKEITMKIPVKLTGTSPGVLNGGSLRFTNRKLKVKALPSNLPDFISADISGLKIGSKLLISSLFNEVYTFMHPDNTVVVQVRTSRNASEDEEATEEATEATEATTEAAATE